MEGCQRRETLHAEYHRVTFWARCSSTYYVNDMITSVNCDLFLYAYDSTLLVSGKNPAVIQNTLSIELNAIRGWLEENKLSIHLGKKESILIASKIGLGRTDIFKISCGSVAIESKSKITYLGLTFDNDMSFSSMGNLVIKKSML